MSRIEISTWDVSVFRNNLCFYLIWCDEMIEMCFRLEFGRLVPLQLQLPNEPLEIIDVYFLCEFARLTVDYRPQLMSNQDLV